MSSPNAFHNCDVWTLVSHVYPDTANTSIVRSSHANPIPIPIHQQKVNRCFTALPSFWQTFRVFSDSRSWLTRESRQKPRKVRKCRNLALCDLLNFALFVPFERIWVSCGSWELIKHTNKPQTLQKKFSQSPNSAHWRHPSAARAWSWSRSWSFLVFLGLLLACLSGTPLGACLLVLACLLGITHCTSLALAPTSTFWQDPGLLYFLTIPVYYHICIMYIKVTYLYYICCI